MSFDIIFSDWLASSFDNVVATKEWNVFISDLHDAVDHQLAENNIDNFNNLLDHEKSIILQKALQSLNGNLCYQIIHEKISQILDLKINSEAERIIRMDVNPFQTRTEAILVSSFEGIISILGRWPDLKYKLSKMFNQNLPNHLRHHIWKAVLDNPEVLEVYQKAMRNKSKNIISKYDKEISQYCEILLNKEPFLYEMKGSVGCFYGMKAILSYYQATVMKDIKLQKCDYFFVIPIVYILCNKLSLREPPTIKVMEVLVQEYFTLRHIFAVDLPFIDSTDKIAQDQYRYFCQQVYKNIVIIDEDSARRLMDHIIPSQETIVATDMKLYDLAGEILEKLLRPIVTTLFVGYLSMETLLFVWDQFLLGFDKAIFREKYWLIITAIFIELIVRRRIINKSANNSLNEEILRNEGSKLKPFDFQYQINKSFYVEIMRIINSSTTTGIDPITESSKWKHWFDSIHHISPISPQDRNDMRILRQNEREKFLQMETQLVIVEQEKMKMEKNSELQSEIYLSNYNKAVDKYKTDNKKLSQELENLQNVNKEKDLTILNLSDELEKLKQTRQRFSDIRSYRGLVPPPVSPTSHMASRQPSPGNYENYSSDGLAQFSLDYISQLANSFQIILNGDGKEKFDLNDETINYLKLFEEDRREAEMILFDRYLLANELESLDAVNEGYYSQKLYQEIAKKTNDRNMKLQSEKKQNARQT